MLFLNKRVLVDKEKESFMQQIELKNLNLYTSKDSNYLIKQCIWAYFLLLIFEGALRKWFLPGLASPLLIVRDPIAVWIIYDGWKKGLIPSAIYLKGIVIIGLIGIYTALFIGHGNLFVALYGARIFLIHLPLMFIIGQMFNHEDVIKIGKATIYISIPMVILTYMQFKSPQSAWVNRGVGGDMAGAGFTGVGDYFRPPGTFSFTTGTTLFFGWLAPFVFYFWLNLKIIKRWLLICATIAMIVSIPVSISRTLLFEIVISLVFTVFAAFRRPEYLGKITLALIIGVFAIVALSQTSFFKTATGAFTERFDTANEVEGGLVKGVIGDRFLGGSISALTESGKRPFFGGGLGMGTNVGSQALSGKQVFLIAEGSWAQAIGELGPLMGLTFIFLRIAIGYKVAVISYKKMILGDFLPWMILSFALLNIMQGGLSQPTTLGFVVISGGLLLASFRNNNSQQAVIR